MEVKSGDRPTASSTLWHRPVRRTRRRFAKADNKTWRHYAERQEDVSWTTVSNPQL